MGLYYVREIVKSHLGFMRVDSTEGEGSCFYIFKWVYSAAANANHNKGLNETSLITLTDKGLLGSFIS